MRQIISMEKFKTFLYVLWLLYLEHTKHIGYLKTHRKHLLTMKVKHFNRVHMENVCVLICSGELEKPSI